MTTSGVKSLIKQKKEEKDRDLKCPICLTEYKKPKLLPCLHTFCQDCLKKYCDEEDDDKIPCPLCRSKFCVLQGGVDKLPDNHFMVRLIYQKGHEEKNCNCDPCREIGEDIKADSFCMECRQSLCQRCTRLHSKLNYTKQHKVVSIEKKPTDYELQRLMSSYCNKHDNNKLELYCCDCRELVCALCHANDHNKHDCRISYDIARLKKELSENDRMNIAECLIVASERKQRLVKAKKDFLQLVSSADSSLRKGADTIRKLIDIYEKELLEELNSTAKKKIKELESEKDLEDLDCTTLVSFHTYSRMMMERGTDCEIIRTSDDLHRRAEELIKDQKKKKKEAMKHDKNLLKFIAPKTPMPEDIKKIARIILYKPIYKNTAGKDAWFRTITNVNIRQVNIEKIVGITVVDDEIFVVGGRQSQVNVYASHSLTESRNINIPGLTSPEGLAGCSYNKALYIGDYEHHCIHRFDLNNNSVTRWKIKDYDGPQDLSMTKEHNLLFIVRPFYEEGNRDFLVEYTSEGQLVREIRVDMHDFYTNFYAWQAVQLSSDQFVVCHGLESESTVGTVSLFNTEGEIIKSYDGERGRGEGQLGYPSSIAIDCNSKHVFVADRDNHRVLMLGTDLAYLGHVHTPQVLREPGYLYFDSSTDRLIVVETNRGRASHLIPPFSLLHLIYHQY